MTVMELIEKLKKFDQDMSVICDGGWCERGMVVGPITEVSQGKRYCYGYGEKGAVYIYFDTDD